MLSNTTPSPAKAPPRCSDCKEAASPVAGNRLRYAPSPCVSLGADASVDIAAIEVKAAQLTINSSRCACCGSIMSEVEMRTKGYATGQELGICIRCASYVNTFDAITVAMKAGKVVYSKPLSVPAKVDVV